MIDAGAQQALATAGNQVSSSAPSSDWIENRNGYWTTLAGFDVLSVMHILFFIVVFMVNKSGKVFCQQS